ncbi:CpaF family protein [Methyloglobulus sp.]|uniref:CpaF family protein n=1 Tax=Methyloglobulus sp. TaxID=2518622 RepID=UPI003989264B
MGLKTRMQSLGLSNKAATNVDVGKTKSDQLNEKPVEVVVPLSLKLLTPVELELKETIHSKLLDILDLSLISSINGREARKQIQSVAQKLIDEESVPLNSQTRHQLIKEIEDDILGLGPLEALLYDPTIADILVNGHKKVYVERFGKLELTPVRFNDNNHLMKIIDRIVSKVGRRIDESSPMVDARLPDGSRVNAIIPPLAIDGPSLSIRRFAVDKMTLDDLVVRGALANYMAEFLKAAAKSKLNILISGGTGSGKTTMLNAISNFIPNNERIITLEDSAELQLQLPHVLRLETRPANIEGKGEITLRDLVRNSLRMRPDRIVIGEVRSGEAFDMLQAMNTGHEGSLTTVHANGPRDALARLENMVSMAGLDMPAKAIRKQIESAIHIIIQLSRLEDGSRRIVSIQEVDGMEGEIITLSEIFKYNRHGIDEKGVVMGQYCSTGIIPKCMASFKQRGATADLAIFTNHLN